MSLVFISALFSEWKITGCPTVCVTCVWAGVDSACEQEKLEARKMLENAQTPTSRVHPIKMAGHHFSRKDTMSCVLRTRCWAVVAKIYKPIHFFGLPQVS